MRRKLSLLLVAALTGTMMLAGCSSSSSTDGAAEGTTAAQTEAGDVTLNVFAAASMTETLNEIESLYEEANPGVDLVFTYGSSGDLETQITEGAACDVFISAGAKQMDDIDSSADAEANPNGNDYVLQGSRVDLLENKVALCMADNSTLELKSFDDLATALQENDDIKFAMGNSDVPVGQYTQKIFEYYGIDEAAIASKITYGSDVKEVTTQITEGSVDCGVVYATDAYSAGLTPVATATAEMCGQVIYPAAVINTSQNADAAQAFLDYLSTEEASAIFEEVGFTPIR